DGRNLTDDEINASGLPSDRAGNRLYLCPSENIYNTEEFPFYLGGGARGNAAQRTYGFTRNGADTKPKRKGVYMPSNDPTAIWAAKLNNRDIRVPAET